jgi:hypothetical protein
MSSFLGKLFGLEEGKDLSGKTINNDAVVTVLKTAYYQERFVDGLISVIEADGLTLAEREFIAKVELHITDKLLKAGEKEDDVSDVAEDKRL